MGIGRALRAERAVAEDTFADPEARQHEWVRALRWSLRAGVLFEGDTDGAFEDSLAFRCALAVESQP